MKRIVIPGILLGLAIASATPARADESFVLNIPQRGDATQEIGEVRILLGLSAAPGGAQLVVNGANTISLNQTQTVAGDSIRFEAASGNVVRIIYQPLSNFAGNFCTGGGATAKVIPLRFAGPQDVVDYRLSSFVVAAPAVECSQVSKRIADMPATIDLTGDGVAPPLVATARGRLPLDLVLVLDKSGSMSDKPPDAAGLSATKVQILKSAFETFVGNWREIDQPTPDGGDWSDDRIGVIFFDSAAASQTLAGADAPANVFVRRGAGGSAWDAVINSIHGLTPGGSTSIGAGLNQGMAQWKGDPLNDVTLFLVTDGMQNTAPLVQPGGNGFLALLPVAGLSQELRKRFIPVVSIGFGTPAAVDEALLKGISLETAGRSLISVNATTIYNAFALTLVSILKGNTASLAMQRSGTLTGPGPAPADDVLVDRSAQRVVFSLQWAPPQRDLLELEAFRPGGAAAAPTSSEHHPQSDIRAYDIRPADLGMWTVRVKRNPRADVSSNVPVPYTLNAFFLEKHLDYRLSLDTIRTGTGDSIGLRVTVSYDGKPLTKLPSGAIRVRIQRPNEGLGNILHDSRVAGGTGNTTTPSGDVLTPYDRKLAQLTGRALLDRITPRDVARVALTEEGRGVYRATFDNTSTPGTYGFDVVLDWDDPRTGHLRREERIEQHVAVKPDAEKTEVRTTRTGNGTVLISITPRDRFGNWMGPGYASSITATVTGGGRLAESVPVDRDQTGTYVFTVTGVPDGVTPDAAITIGGGGADNPITVHTAGGSGGTRNPWGPFAAWRAFIDAGPSFPHGNFSNGVDGRWSVSAGLERQLSPVCSFEAAAGYHLFKTALVSNPHIWELSAGGKRFFGTAPFRPFVNAGIGAYRFDPGHRTKGGANGGGGVLYELSPRFGIEGLWNYHWIRTTPDHSSFSAVQFGVRFSL